jgi:hypothetical protein
MTRGEFLGKAAGAVALASLAGIALSELKGQTAGVNLTFGVDRSHTLRNPERGWWYDLSGDYETNREKWYTQAELINIRDTHNVTIARQYYQLDRWRTQYIPQWHLDEVQGMFDKIRNAGMKLIPRWRYNWNQSLGSQDTTEAWINRHMDQVQPILERNVDVIDHVQCGWIGMWGEHHNSTTGHTPDGQLAPSGVRIFLRMQDIVPEERIVVYRYPRHTSRSDTFGSAMFDASEAYTGTRRARMGHHIDGLFHDPTHWNTLLAPWHKYYIRSFGLYNVSSGEPAWDSHWGRQNFLSELRYMAYSSLNMNWQDPNVQGLYNYIKTTTAPGESISIWNVCHRDFGYRLRLTTARVPNSATAGQSLPLTLNFQNDGWARPYNPREFVIVLRNKDTGQSFEIPYTEGEVRRLLGAAPQGGQSTVEWAPTVPANVPTGSYDLILWMPDPKPSLRARPGYAIRLANTHTWEPATGYNVLYSQLSI